MQFNSDPDTVQAKAANIELLLLDVDGVLTDGRLYYTDAGEEIKAFSSLDGHGIKQLQEAGIEVGIMTGRNSRLLSRRAENLGIDLLYQGCADKLEALEDILRNRQLHPEQVAYAGDDFPDLPVLLAVGLSFSVPSGHPDVRQRVAVVTGLEAGQGAVREITDFLLKAGGHYASLLPD